MMSIKEYAADRGVSYEAVRRQVKRYKDELEGHVIQKGRQQLLDDFAVAFLDEHRAAQPMVTYDQATGAAVKRLDEENKQLLREVAALSKWQTENALKIAAADQTVLLLKAAEDDKAQLQTQLAEEKAAHQADNEAAAAAKEKADQAAQEAAERAQKDQETIRELEKKLAEEDAARAEAVARADALARRGLIDRILNRGV